MKKKEKARPRSCKLAKEASIQKRVFDYYFKEMEEKTEEYNKSHNSFVNFELAQTKTRANKSDLINKVLDLSYFYDTNFIGNKDFMHIPSFGQVASNLLHYPILLATQKMNDGSDDILGITTIKYEKHNDLKENPYFPTRDENVLSITGVLTKSAASNDRVRGIGKELYKSAIKAAVNLNQEKRIRLVCEIDCRNERSMNAITKAVIDLQDEGYNISSYITGYYEIYNKQKQLVEAPTFILEVNLNSNKYENTYAEFSYAHCKSQRLYADLVKQIKDNVKEQRRYLNIVGQNQVVYHSIKPINTQNIDLFVGNSAEGNERTPRLNPVLEYVMSRKTKEDTANFALAE